MTSIQNHETSYENGQKPYKHDSKRGKWEIPGDFFFACLNSSFTSSHFSSLMYIFFFYNDSLLITFLYYLLTIAVYVVPVFFMQSFLGQFSSSGYISVFRIAPFFKGLGYVILLLNFMVLTYVVLFAAVPLFYTVASLVHLPDILECRNNTWNTQNCSALTVSLDYDWNNLDYETMQKYKNLPSYEYYNFHLGVFTDRNYFYDEEDNKPLDTTFNWSIFACCLVIWAVVYYITTRDIDLIGKINRYMTLGLMAILLMFTIRALSTKQLIQSLGTIFDLSHIRIDGHLSAFITSPLICLHVFGRGWGIPLVMASHNKFNTNTSNLSWAVVLGNILITTACMFITTVFYGVLDSNVDRFHITFEHPLESIYVGFPAVFGLMKFPRFWLLLLFIMLTLSEVFGIVMQLSAFFTSFFDEFDEFRMLKKEITMGIIGFFVFTTTFYCSNHGYNFFRAMSFTQITLQGMIFLFLILVVMWIYGKERFQRDVFFMLGIKYPTHIINIVRFVVPLFLIITTLFGIGLTYSSMGRSPFYETIAVTIIKVVPWILIPGYMVYSLVRATGPFMTKLRKLNRPTDWFPTEMEDRQRYESVLGSSDISHQLSVTVVEETGLVEDDQD